MIPSINSTRLRKSNAKLLKTRIWFSKFVIEHNEKVMRYGIIENNPRLGLGEMALTRNESKPFYHYLLLRCRKSRAGNAKEIGFLLRMQLDLFWKNK